MFERFTDRGRRVIVLAQDEARLFGHDYVGTEHILLGLIHVEGEAAKVLEAQDISLKAVREIIVEIVGRGATSPPGHITFTPRAKMVLELTLREALQLGHNYVSTEHLLLGLIREGAGIGMQVLAKLGQDPDRLRQLVIQAITPAFTDTPKIMVVVHEPQGSRGPFMSIPVSAGEEFLSWYRANALEQEGSTPSEEPHPLQALYLFIVAGVEGELAVEARRLQALVVEDPPADEVDQATGS